MLVMEHLMRFTPIRLCWSHSDRQLLSDTLFIKDGPLTLRGQYSDLVPPIRAFLRYAKERGRPVHVIGQEKTGTFADHLVSIVRFAEPHARGELPSYAAITHHPGYRQRGGTPRCRTPPAGARALPGPAVAPSRLPGQPLGLPRRSGRPKISAGRQHGRPSGPGASRRGAAELCSP